MQHWLVKSEPSCYSIQDLQRDKITAWTDVRNYQARNFLRAMKKGDTVLFYHSSCTAVGIVGVATVEKEAYPDPTQFDLNSEGYEKASTKENPRWSAVDMRFAEIFTETLSLTVIKHDKALAGIEVAKQGSRLSVQPVTRPHFKKIAELTSKKRTV